MSSTPSSIQDEFPENLAVEPGGNVEGSYRRTTRGRSKDGTKECPVVVLDVGGTERAVWLWEEAARKQFRALRPEPGELVRIAKGGEKKVSQTTGNEYWPVRVVAPERPAETVDWDDPLFGPKPSADGIALPDGDTEVPPPTAAELESLEPDAKDLPPVRDEDIPF